MPNFDSFTCGELVVVKYNQKYTDIIIKIIKNKVTIKVMKNAKNLSYSLDSKINSKIIKIKRWKI